jgi:outer membrane protein TolC
MSDKEHFIAELKYTYPIFSGFLVTANIQKAKIKLIQSNLKLQNTRRVLILNSAKLYSSIYALSQQLKALISAKKSLILAKDKVNALYEEGLVDKSQVSEIEAKYYEIDSTIKEIDAKRKNLINTLNTLLNISIKDVEGLDNINLKSNLLAKNRPDVKEVYKRLEIAKIEEKIAKSNFYPKVGFVASLKREGDNFFITKNDYQNIDKSFVGIGIEWNLFNGGADRKKLEITKIAKLQSLLYYKNYLNDAKRELKDDLNILRALNSRLKASFLEVKAREEYYQKIKSKFEEGLADSVDLSNAIAKLAEAKSKRDYIKSQIFFYTIKANLDGGKSD